MKKVPFILLSLSFAAGLAAQAPHLVVPIGHTGRVTSVAVSPGGQQVLTGSWDGTAKLWDLSGREIQSFSGHTSGISSVAFSPDGQQVLTGSFDNTVKLWKVSGGAPLMTFEHITYVNSVAFSPDGQKVLTGSGDGVARLWKISGGNPVAFSGHASEITSVAFSPDGQKVLTGSFDRTAKLWNVTGGAPQTFTGHLSVVSAVAFSPDGQKVLTGSWDGTTRLWPVTGGNPQVFKGHAFQVRAVAFSPDGKKIGTGGGDGTVIWWDLSGRDSLSFSGHASIISSIAFSPDGLKLLTGSFDKTVKLWSLSGREMQCFKGHSFAISSVAWSSGGRQMLTGSIDGMAKLWDLSGREVQTFRGHDSLVWAVAFSPDGQQVLTASADSTAKLWDITGREIQTFKGHQSDVFSVVFSPDGQQVLTASADSTAKLWNVTGKEVQTFRGHASFVRSAVFSPDGRQILTGSGDRSVLLWNLSGGIEKSLSSSVQRVSSAVFSPDGQKVLIGGSDKTATLRALSGGVSRIFSGHADALTSVAFSPDGQKILTGSGDRTAKLWNLSSPDTLTFKGHTSFVRSAVFSPDGQKVLTGSDDNTVKIWDAHTGQCLMTLISLDSSEWVVTTPSGLFDASPGAMNLMYFLQGLEVIELEQLKERYYEPGLLSKLMGFSSEPMRSVAAFEAIAMYPLIQLRLDSAKHQLHIALQPRDGGMGQLSVFVNGKEIIEDALRGAGPGRSRDTVVVLDLEPYARYFLSDTLNTVAVRAYNRENWLRSPLHMVTYRPEFVGAKGGPGETTASPTPFRRKRNPALHLLLVGVHDYAGTTLDLKFTAKDAEDMANALQQSGAQLFGADSVFVHLLSTTPGQKSPSKVNIQAAFGAIAARAKAEDILLAYFSGHGVNYGEAEKSLFYFLTMETGSFDLSDPGIRAARAISSEELTRWINLVPAQKQVLIVDACNSGKMVEDMGAGGKSLTASQIRALDRMKDRTGLFILSGSAANQKSFEASKFRQSLLTYSLLEAMQGAALNDRDIDVIRLFDQARTRVRELAAELSLVQEPVPNYPRNAGTIFIGRVNDNVNIELARAGAVFVSSAFQDEAQFNDPLSLADAVNSYLREEDAAGAGFLFFDLKNIPDAYSIKGLYTVSGDVATVRVRLFKGKTQVGEVFTVKGAASAVPKLVEDIMARVSGMIR